MATSQYDFEVFIAHCREDADMADRLHKHLNKNGIPSFCDLVDDPTACLGSKIYDIIRNSTTFLVITTEAALAAINTSGSWLRGELECAIGANLRIVELRVPSVRPGIGVTPLISTIAQPVQVCRSETTQSTLRTIHQVLRSESIALPEALSAPAPAKIDLKALLEGIISTVTPEFTASVRQCAARFLSGFSDSTMPPSRQDLVEAAILHEDAGLLSLINRAVAVDIVRKASKSAMNLGGTCTDLRPIWKLMRSTLGRAAGLPLRVTTSSQGFLTAPLFSIVQGGRIEEMIRLHYWPARGGWVRPPSYEWEPGSQFSVHSHQAYGQSWLLHGEVLNIVYNVEGISHDSQPFDQEASLFTVSWDGSTSYSLRHRQSVLRNTGQRVHVSVDNFAAFRAGQSYSVPAGQFHKSRSGVVQRGPSVTLFYFDSSQGWLSDAPVVGPTSLRTSPSHSRESISEEYFLSNIDALAEDAS